MQLTNIESIKTWLKKDNDNDDSLLEMIVNGVSKRMEMYMGRSFGEQEFTSEPIESPGYAAIVVGNSPIIRVISITENATLLVTTDYRVEGAGMIVRLTGGNTGSWGVGTVYVSYEAGYVEVPDDIQFACVMQSAREYKLSVPGGGLLGVSSVSPTQATGESTSYEMKPWLPHVESAMRPYRVFI